MPNTLAGNAPTDGLGNAFVGAVTTSDGAMHALEGGTTTAITGSPSGGTATRLVVETKDGGSATMGALADAAYSGSGSASLVALLKGIYAKVANLFPAGSNTSLTSPPTNTNAGSDTSLTFASTVNHWSLQNNSSANLYYNLDAAASTGTFVLAPGAQVWWDWPITVLHVYTTAAIPVNAASGLRLIGRA